MTLLPAALLRISAPEVSRRVEDGGQMATLVRELFDGPIDIGGDVHGEIQALNDLLARLGYEPDGRHPQGRRLVFVGDLGDRGPDSPGVVLRIRDLVERGTAQCVLGNHDFNALWATHG